MKHRTAQFPLKAMHNLVWIAMFLAFVVVVLGAYTRLTDAGLGCPDWPGCYGHLVLPLQDAGLKKAQEFYPYVPIETQKAWTEMTHRYAAGTLAVLVMIINGLAWRHRHRGAPWKIPLTLLGLIGFQAALGMWTVTLKLLPVVVMGHLLGGIIIFSCLVYLNWQLSENSGAKAASLFWRLGMYGAIAVVFLQIALGGWVSSHYAGIACIGFPMCNGQWFPSMHWRESFQIWTALDANYQGGLLASASRVTIQMAHRIWAVVTVLYVVIFALLVLYKIPHRLTRRVTTWVLICLGLQYGLGIVNVLYLLPLWAAVAHNGIAALLFAAIVSWKYSLLSGTSRVSIT